MKGLPFGLAEPLHIEEPFPTWKLVLAGLVLWLIYRLLRLLWRWLQRVEVPASPVPPAPPSFLDGFAVAVDEIRRRYGDDYRRGCHALAEALRGHFDALELPGSAGRAPYPTLTAREIEGQLGDTPVSRLFTLLSDLQFYPREPTKGDFEGACELAVDVAASSKVATRRVEK